MTGLVRTRWNHDDAPGRAASAVCWYLIAFGALNIVNIGRWAVVDPDHITGEFVTVSVVGLVLKVLGGLIAQATIRDWGRRIPAWMLLGFLSGAATVMLTYPFEGVALTLVGWNPAVDEIDWVTSAIIAAFFLPFGVLYALVARDFRRRTGTRHLWAWTGAATALLLLNVPIVLASR